MRSVLILVLLLCCAPAGSARADWFYEPPPVGAVVTYDDGHTSRIDAVSGERFTVINKTKGKSERVVYRTWLIRERFLVGRRASDELYLDSAAANNIVKLWPLQPGETFTHSFRTERKGKLQTTGTQVLTYIGIEPIEVPAGTFEAHRLERKYVLTNAADGKQYRGREITWHDLATGLILRDEWESDEPEGAGTGSFVATELELP